MKVEYINPFIESTLSVFSTMLNCKLTRSDLYVGTKNTSHYAISGVIGLCGEAVGTVVLRMNRDMAISATEMMLGERPAEVNADVKDAVGELSNMVAGGAKAQLSDMNMGLTIPTVVIGDCAIEFPSKMPPLCIEFCSDWGPLTVEVGLIYKSTPVAV